MRHLIAAGIIAATLTGCTYSPPAEPQGLTAADAHELWGNPNEWSAIQEQRCQDAATAWDDALQREYVEISTLYRDGLPYDGLAHVQRVEALNAPYEAFRRACLS
jgi:hypothetical protein